MKNSCKISFFASLIAANSILSTEAQYCSRNSNGTIGSCPSGKECKLVDPPCIRFGCLAPSYYTCLPKEGTSSQSPSSTSSVAPTTTSIRRTCGLADGPGTCGPGEECKLKPGPPCDTPGCFQRGYYACVPLTTTSMQPTSTTSSSESVMVTSTATAINLDVCSFVSPGSCSPGKVCKMISPPCAQFGCLMPNFYACVPEEAEVSSETPSPTSSSKTVAATTTSGFIRTCGVADGFGSCGPGEECKIVPGPPCDTPGCFRPGYYICVSMSESSSATSTATTSSLPAPTITDWCESSGYCDQCSENETCQIMEGYEGYENYYNDPSICTCMPAYTMTMPVPTTTSDANVVLVVTVTVAA